ncbi:MAG: hypothetical protein OXI96_03840 [Acidimicrobiaceae bacterium]|nr:hypothetical protein [Acidimicrobiaceae bacterium]
MKDLSAVLCYLKLKGRGIRCSGGVIPLQRLCDDISVSRNTGNAYLHLLTRIHLAVDPPSYHTNRICYP